jgi:hypothetical protein
MTEIHLFKGGFSDFRKKGSNHSFSARFDILQGRLWQLVDWLEVTAKALDWLGRRSRARARRNWHALNITSAVREILLIAMRPGVHLLGGNLHQGRECALGGRELADGR